VGTRKRGTLLVERRELQMHITQTHNQKTPSISAQAETWQVCFYPVPSRSKGGQLEPREQFFFVGTLGLPLVSTVSSSALRLALGNQIATLLLALGFSTSIVITLLWLLFPVSSPRRVFFCQCTVSTDGLAIESRKHTFFVPFFNIRTVLQEGSRITLYLDNKQSVDLCMKEVSSKQASQSFFLQLQNALQIHHDSHTLPAASAPLLRGDRSLNEWHQAVFELAQHSVHNHYRNTTFIPEMLEEFLTNPRSSAELRIASAWALSVFPHIKNSASFLRLAKPWARPHVASAVRCALRGSKQGATIGRALEPIPTGWRSNDT
jgi:hypothetical protein